MFIKRKEFEELKNQVSELKNDVEVLKFWRENPMGLEIEPECGHLYVGYNLRYIKGNKIKSIALPIISQSSHYELCGDNLIVEVDVDCDFHKNYKRSINKKYKFDIANELLIELQEPQKENKPTETKPSNVKKPKKVICVSEDEHTGATLPTHIIRRYKQLKPFMKNWTSSHELAKNLGTTYYNTMGYIKVLSNYGLINKRGTKAHREYQIKKLEDIE